MLSHANKLAAVTAALYMCAVGMQLSALFAHSHLQGVQTALALQAAVATSKQTVLLLSPSGPCREASRPIQIGAWPTAAGGIHTIVAIPMESVKHS